MFQKISRKWGLILLSLLVINGCRAVHVSYENGRSITYVQVLNNSKIGTFEAENNQGAKLRFSDIESKVDAESIGMITGTVLKGIMLGFGIPIP